MDGSGLLAKAAKLLVLAVMMDLVPVIDALLNRVLYFIKSQLRERVQPALTAGQIGVLHGKHRDITERLVQRVAKAHADQLRQDIPFSRVAACHDARPLSPRVGYLAGPLDNADLAHGVLAKEGQDTWLIIGRDDERCRTPWADGLVDLYSRINRLLVLKGAAEQQAADVRTLNLDVLVLITYPTEELEYILASNPARHTINWRGMSNSLTDLCQFTMIGSCPGADSMRTDPQVIRVGFDQPVRASRFLCGSTKKSLDREKLGLLPTASYVVMFPGFLVQLDKHSLWTWMQLVAGLDSSVLALTAEPASMVATVHMWVEEFAQRHCPFAISRVLFLEWQGHEIHAARIGHSSLCVAPLNPMFSAYFAASVLAEGVGLLVLKGTGSTDVWASGLGALLIAANADDFVQKGHAWASQQRDAIAFLLEQKEKGIGYFNTDRVPDAMSTIFEAVLAGGMKGRFERSVVADSVLVFENDKKAWFSGNH